MARVSTTTSPELDRFAALRAMGPEQLAEIFRRVPAVAASLDRRGPLAAVGLSVPGLGATDLRSLARLLASEPVIDVTLAALDRTELQLAALAAWHGGRLAQGQLEAELEATTGPGGGVPAHLEAARVGLASLLLAEPPTAAGADPWLVLRAGVAEVVELPGIPIEPALTYVPSDDLGRLVRQLGRTPPPTKRERVAVCVQALRDEAVVVGLLERAPDEAVRILQILLEHGPQQVRDLGIPHYSTWGRVDTPLHWLSAHQLVGVDAHDQVAWVWLDVVVALSGSLFADWSPAPVTAAQPIVDATVALPATAGRMSALLENFASDPAPALANGGLGVRPVRAAAKTLGCAPGEVGLLASLAINVGMLGTTVVKTTGRGRNRKQEEVWRPTGLAERWHAEDPVRRWALLVQAWREDLHLNELDGLPERCDTLQWSTDATPLVARDAFLRVLGELPPGEGVAEEDLVAVAGFRFPRLLAGTTPHLLAAARALGLVTATGPVGLTPAGRALLDGVQTLRDALPPPRRDVIVQADHTVIAPPDLDPELTTRLERYAELESAAGARVYRLSEQRIMLAMDAGETAEDVLAFLQDASQVELAQNVRYLVADCARRHGRLRAGAALSYLRTDDAALLSQAVDVRAAKLRLLAPTVAVSSLAVGKLTAALRQRGLLAITEDADGAVLRDTAAAATPTLRSRGQLPVLHQHGSSGSDELRVRAKRLIEAAPPATQQPAPTSPGAGHARGDASLQEQRLRLHQLLGDDQAGT